jgi:hypothetical protein
MDVVSARLRTRAPGQDLAAQAGKVVSDDAYNLLLTGPAELLMPDGRPLAVYLPGALTGLVTDEQYGILHQLRTNRTDNRGMASGSTRGQYGEQKRSYALPVASSLLGAVDPGGTFKYCRLTVWTGSHLPQWETLRPLLAAVAGHLKAYVPARHAAQQAQIDRTHPDWVIPGTPFTTVTVNNTYPTGVHTDKGDLEAGFSTIFTLRRGPYTGGRLVFPEWRAAVDMGHGDLLLMDAHQWHGNTPIICGCGRRVLHDCGDCGAERISVVTYMRAKLTGCGSEADEQHKATTYRERTKGIIREEAR